MPIILVVDIMQGTGSDALSAVCCIDINECSKINDYIRYVCVCACACLQMCACIIPEYLHHKCNASFFTCLPGTCYSCCKYPSFSSLIRYSNRRNMSVLLCTCPYFTVYLILLNSGRHALFSDSTQDQGSSISCLELLQSDEEVSASEGVDFHREWRLGWRVA
jgi:hypothetical protein